MIYDIRNPKTLTHDCPYLLVNPYSVFRTLDLLSHTIISKHQSILQMFTQPYAAPGSVYYSEGSQH